MSYDIAVCAEGDKFPETHGLGAPGTQAILHACSYWNRTYDCQVSATAASWQEGGYGVGLTHDPVKAQLQVGSHSKLNLESQDWQHSRLRLLIGWDDGRVNMTDLDCPRVTNSPPNLGINSSLDPYQCLLPSIDAPTETHAPV